MVSPLRLRALLAVAVLLLTGAGPAAAEPAGAATEAIHDAQPGHDYANLDIRGEGNAAAQVFVTADTELRSLGAWIVSESTTGTVVASVRTDVTDPATEVADAVVDLEALGGTGKGWLRLSFDDVEVRPGEPYALVLQATGTDGPVTWWGDRDEAPGAPMWNHDLSYWGGWVQYGAPPAERFASWNLAFYVNDSLAPGGCAAVNECWRPLATDHPEVNPAGLLGTPGNRYALSTFEVAGAQYVRASSVLELPDGQWLYLPDGAIAPTVVPAGHAEALAQIEESRAWLASGTVPGADDDREMSERALLDMRLLLQQNGAVAAAWFGAWKYSWPRDSAFTSVAFTVTGHLEESYRILRFIAETQRADGTWEARTRLDGSGPPDSRGWQLDANGWFPWATWQYLQAAPEEQREAAIAELYPTVRAAADHAAASLDENGIPPARPDYWESGYPAPNLGTAAPLLAGLRAAAAIAETAEEHDDATRWFAAADHLQRGIDMSFGSIGYQRTIVAGSGKDSAVTWLAPPFNPADDVVLAELDTSWQALVQETGGVQPGEAWRDDMTWTPETMFFALAWAQDGQTDRAAALVSWLDDHRTSIGAFPEKVDPQGRPAAVATLGWTASLAVMTLAALESPLPVPPAGTAQPAAAAADDTAADNAATPALVTTAGLLGLFLAAALLLRRRRR
ncbi:hypothetical protein [Georgenia sp. MJ170]|uniref:hypothetical protein n=1 Tax=Georgenia sunbinii TaxID=3117728 RepID=UPI002F2607B4